MVDPVYVEPRVTLYQADCLDVLPEMPEASVDTVVTDPPYGLEFMGKEWDRFGDQPSDSNYTMSRSGGRRRHGNYGTVTDHMNRSESYGPWGRRDRPINPNDASHRNEKCVRCGKWRVSSNPCRCDKPEWQFRIRDHAPPAMVAYQNWTEQWAREVIRVLKPGAHLLAFGGTRTFHRLTCALEDAGFEIRDCLSWLYGSGFPKSLDVSRAIDKAASAEREPDDYTGANFKNQIYGRGLGGGVTLRKGQAATDAARHWAGWGTALKPAWEPIILARKPLSEPNVAANVQRWGTGAINVDGCRIPTDWSSDPTRRGWQGTRRPDDGFFSRGVLPHAPRSHTPDTAPGRWPANLVLDEEAARILDKYSGERDISGASRFFYTAKADRDDRDGTRHPTVKPVELMKWLVRLLTPSNGLVLDPFMGSGTTIYAARELGFRAIGIDREPEYVHDAIRRLRQGVLL